MSNTLKKVESVEDGVNLVLGDDRVIKVTSNSSDDVTELGYILKESDEDEIKVESDDVDSLIKELEDKYDLELSEDNKEELKEALETDTEKLDPLQESEDNAEDEVKAEADEEELKEEDEDEVKTEEDEEEKKPVSEKKKRKSEADEEPFKLSEELNDLLEVELGSDVKDKIDVAFDTIVKEKVKKLKEAIEDENKEELKESIATLEKAVGVYLEQAAKTYVKQNKLALSEGLRYKYFERFFGKMRKLFSENYIELKESDEEIVTDLKKENEELKECTHKLVSEVKALNESVVRLNREKEITKAASDMYLTESERFQSAAKQLLKESAKLSDEKFTKKLALITEMFKAAPKKKATGAKILSEGNTKVITEKKDEMHPDVSRLLNNW